MIRYSTILPAILLFSLATSDAFANMYRYKDNSGSVHIGYSIPPEFVENGYEVLNESGLVVKTVLPKAVLDAQAAEKLKEAEARHKLELQQAKDEALLRYYSSPADVERARERKLTQFDNFIRIQERNIASYQTKMKELQGQAAQLQRAGRDVPEAIVETLETLEEKVRDANVSVKAKHLEKKTVYAAFQADIERIKYLLDTNKEPISLR